MIDYCMMDSKGSRREEEGGKGKKRDFFGVL
jgi:hypothetical protein